MEYQISFQKPLTHYLDIRLTLKKVEKSLLYLQLPAWRPGRYQLANYARNLQELQVTGTQNIPLAAVKVTKDRWKVSTRGNSIIHIKYRYFAHQMDAGGSLLDDQQLYINFINCLIYAPEYLDKPCRVELLLPESYHLACGLKQKGNNLLAKDYYQLVDSPMIASPLLKHWTFQAKSIRFHLWFMGSHKLPKTKTINAFKSFCSLQIKMMGGFPEKDFHFLYQIPPRKIYHGVEHGNSTVIALGPGKELHKERYDDFLGVSSHELFHAWNIIKIRPKKLLPYDFTKEIYFEEGYIAEGVTSYYGDLFLVRSGVMGPKKYFKEIDTLLKRHFENEGRRHASLIESSWDLWLDGYQASAPGRKVSIYTKGALAALMLDLSLRIQSQGKVSLDDVMRTLWREYGLKNKGYTNNDFQKICQKLSRQNFQQFFDDFIRGTATLEPQLNSLLDHVGCRLKSLPSKQIMKSHFGVRCKRREGKLRVVQIAPGSAAEDQLSLGDIILRVNGKHITKNINKAMGKSVVIKLHIDRDGRKELVKLTRSKLRFFEQYRIVKQKSISQKQRQYFENWLQLEASDVTHQL